MKIFLEYFLKRGTLMHASQENGFPQPTPKIEEK